MVTYNSRTIAVNKWKGVKSIELFEGLTPEKLCVYQIDSVILSCNIFSISLLL